MPTERLTQIDGAMPRLTAIPKGCAFNPRCQGVRANAAMVDRPDLMAAGDPGGVLAARPVLRRRGRRRES